MKQAVHKFSGFLGPVHSVNFFFRRGKFLIRGKQIIGQNPIQQMIQRRIKHHFIEIIMVGGIVGNRHLCGVPVKLDQGFRVSIRRGGGIRFAHT